MPDAEAASDDGTCPYVVGESYARRRLPSFEYKAGATGYTGGGYARVRSVERGPEVSRPGMGDVFVSIHRLIAVARCYPDDWTVAEIQRDMVGKDVHHTLGMPSANVPDELEVITHGEHSAISNAQRRAWAEDAKERVEAERQGRLHVERCAECGDSEDDAVLCTTASLEETFCMDCVVSRAGDERIDVL